MDPAALRRSSILVAGVVAVVVAVATVWFVRRDDTADVVVVGDSVSYLSAGAIGERFDRGHLQLITTPGYTDADLLPVVQEAMGRDDLPGGSLERVVVLVGYNNVLQDRVESDALDDLRDASSRFDCAVWFTLPARPGGQPSTYDGLDPDGVERWNARLVQATEGDDHVHLDRRWQDLVERTPPEELLSDGLHPNGDGQQRLADAYRDAVDEHC